MKMKRVLGRWEWKGLGRHGRNKGDEMDERWFSELIGSGAAATEDYKVVFVGGGWWED
jgi:hypothetical protein